VLEPRAADRVVALADDEILDPALAEPDAEADAGESGADHNDLVVLGGRAPRRGLLDFGHRVLPVLSA